MEYVQHEHEGQEEYESGEEAEYIEGEYSEGEEHDGQIEGEEYEEGLDEEHMDEELDGEIADADEEEESEGEDGAAAANGPGQQPQQQQQQQMLYIPGLGYFPLSSLGGIPGMRQPPQQQPEGEKEWTTLASFPEATKTSLHELLGQLQAEGREELTVLLLGKGGVGKSSTVNSLLNERAATVTAFQQDTARPTVFSRTAAGFTLHLVDTPSLLDGDNVSDKRLEDIGKCVEERDVDAVLYLDRLDNYKLGLQDKRVLAGISRVLGPSVWNNTILCFTRASESSCPPRVDFEDFADQRAQQLRDAIAKVGGRNAELPLALIENSSGCQVNAEDEKVVPSGEVWITEIMSKIKDMSLTLDPYVYDPAAARKAANPDRRRKWLIPLVLLAQVGLKLLLDRVMEEDGVKGDANGPFDPETVKERREELKRDKDAKKRQDERTKAARKRSVAAEELSSTPLYDFDEEDELEDEEDEYY